MSNKTMETKTNEDLSFEDLMGSFIPETGLNPESSSDNIPYKDPEEIEAEEKEQDELDKEDNNDTDKETEDKSDDDSKDNKDSDSSDLGEYESEAAAYLAERLASELDWTFDEDTKFENVKDVVDYMKKVVDEASKPVYPNEEIERIAKFVEDGGNIHDYYKQVYTENNLDELDLETESDQKYVIRENLKDLGYNQERINKTLKRYEDAGVLEEEAKDAHETLKSRREKNAKKLLEDQENQRKYMLEQQQKFVSSVTENVKSMKDFYGLSLSEKDKKELLDYIFKPQANGQTKYQEDYAKEGSKNLIESALFLKNKNVLFKEVTKQAKSEVAKTFAQKLRERNTTKLKGSGSGSGVGNDSLASLSNFLIKK